MDILSRVPAVLGVALLDAGFAGGLTHAIQSALATANAPTTPEAWGTALGTAFMLVASQLFQAWRNRKRISDEVQQAVAGHLAGLRSEPPADAV